MLEPRFRRLLDCAPSLPETFTDVLRFVVALDAEARPLVERFELRYDPEVRPFKVYRGDAGALIVAGIGKAAAAAATSYLQLAAGGERQAVWLNVGVAGHSHLAMGEALLAHKVKDRASGRCWYPPQVIEPPCATDAVTTVDRPERAYREPGAFEMEASGFYPTACRFASAELVHCVKIVSDGPDNALEHLTLEVVEELVAQQLAVVERLAGSCLELAKELADLEADPQDFEQCLSTWRFTVSESRELRRQLRRRQTLAPDEPLPVHGLVRGTRGKQVLARLRPWLDELALQS
ncbi:MAG: hypothetical protein AAF560_28550 [Acidobacteriota bacterium]